MTTVMALLLSILGIQGSGSTPSDGTGGSGHGAVFDASGPSPAYTPAEYAVGM